MVTLPLDAFRVKRSGNRNVSCTHCLGVASAWRSRRRDEGEEGEEGEGGKDGGESTSPPDRDLILEQILKYLQS